MKVWELIAELEKIPAGREVTVSVAGALGTAIVCFYGGTDDDPQCQIQGSDAELVGDGGDAIGTTSEFCELDVLAEEVRRLRDEAAGEPEETL